jgi:hypothetical protein
VTFRLRFTKEASATLDELESVPQHAKKLKKVRKALGLLQTDPRYPGLHSHKYGSIKGQNGEEVWDSYVENKTPSAWRIFWHYGPEPDTITVLLVTPHP